MAEPGIYGILCFKDDVCIGEPRGGGGPLTKRNVLFLAINNVLELYPSKVPPCASSFGFDEGWLPMFKPFEEREREVLTRSLRIWIWRLVTLGYGAPSWSAWLVGSQTWLHFINHESRYSIQWYINVKKHINIVHPPLCNSHVENLL